MSSTTPETPSGATTSAGEVARSSARSQSGSGSTTELVTSQGKTSIADGVVRKIAGIAAREVNGVHNLGTGGTRAFGALRERIPGSGGPNISQGVTVEVGERQAAIDLDIVVEYGVAIADLAQAIRRNVITAVERMTGLEVAEVNISVDDIFIAGDDSNEEPAPSRVQ
ncbi:MAG: hypothetical protein QOJ32_2321 [Frankiaceae bacterium]|jgi:uncharacterized alkaline shock family protein YloU|nr:hypothetical protein [Frankiaceae bacterium]MDQ1674306.1 hypothetical protein [Frankiaceae bacterium]